jgi:hypothetical protein
VLDVHSVKASEAKLKASVPLHLLPPSELTDEEMFEMAEKCGEIGSSVLKLSTKVKKERVDNCTSGLAPVSEGCVVVSSTPVKDINEVQLMAELDSDLDEDTGWENTPPASVNKCKSEFLAPDKKIWAIVNSGGDNLS